MTNPDYRWNHQQQRRAWQAVIDSDEPVNCADPNCRHNDKRIKPGERWDLGHIVAIVDGGHGGPRRPMHADCNRADGGRRTPRPTPGHPLAL